MSAGHDAYLPLAAAVAGAFLRGAWTPEAMGARAGRVLDRREPDEHGGRRPRRWLVHVAAEVVAAYPLPPRDRPRQLTATVASAIRAAAAAGAPVDPAAGDRPRTWPAAPTAMGPARWPVAPLPDMAALATWLGVDGGRLAWFADVRSMERTARDEALRHYTRRWVAKGDGSARLLEAPKRELKDMQRLVLRQVLDRIPPHPAAHGFRPGRSALTAAAAHAGRAVVVRLDLESFFASVSAGRAFGLFRLAGYPEAVAHALAGLCTTATPLAVLQGAPPANRERPATVERRRRLLQRLAGPHLAQGSPTSPALANLVAHRLDRRLAGVARAWRATYTRYADDLVFSGDRGLGTAADHLAGVVAEIARDEGFRLHDGKTRVRTAAQRQVVTGLVVNERPQVARHEVDRLRAVLHDAARRGPEAANRHGHPDFRSHLQGRIAWVAATSPSRAAKLERAFAAIAW
jgi:RNA-directed DNA polymerase